MLQRHAVRVMLVALCSASTALAITYSWDGSGDEYWDNCANWVLSSTPACYPQTLRDDAIIPADDDAPWPIRLSSEAIDDLIVRGDVVFTHDVGLSDTELEVDALQVIGGASGAILTVRTTYNHAISITAEGAGTSCAG